MNPFIVVVALYPVLLIGVSLWRARRIGSHADFAVAGRNVSTTLLAGTLVSTWIGSGSLFGGAGLAYRSGLSELWFVAGGWLSLWAVYRLAPRVRRMARMTIPDLLECRYNAAARVLGTVSIVIAYVTVTAYQFRGGGWILALVTDGRISPGTGVWLTAAAVIAFTALGGMLSIVTVDVFNGIVIALGIFAALPFMVTELGGVAAVIDRLPENHLAPLGDHNPLWAIGVALPLLLLVLAESGLYQKFFAAADERSAARAVRGMIVGVVAIETSLALLAITGRAAFPGLMSQTSIVGPAASETILLHIARFGLPLALGAPLLAAAVAIVLTTANTFLLVPSTSVVNDLYVRFIHPDASESRKTGVQRLAVVCLGLLAVLLLSQFETVLAMALYSYSLVGASLSPALLAAFLWRRATPIGGVACIGGGMGTILTFIVADRVGLDLELVVGSTAFDFASPDYVVIPAVLVSVSLLIGVSLMTSPPAEERWRIFQEHGAAGPG